MRILASLIFAIAISSHSMAAEPLPAGKAAGAKQAVSKGEEVYLMLGAGIIGGVLIASLLKFGGSSTTGTSS